MWKGSDRGLFTAAHFTVVRGKTWNRMSGDVLTTWSEKFLDADTVFFQIISLGEATYVWVGHEDARLDSLALGVPSPLTPTAAGTTLLGSGADPASKSMAQRLAKKLGQPVFVAMTLRDDPDLRFFAQGVTKSRWHWLTLLEQEDRRGRGYPQVMDEGLLISAAAPDQHAQIFTRWPTFTA